ncbi:helicase, partial [Streptomyces griseofuscus]
EGKVASLVVPVLLDPGETADNMLTSRPYNGLALLFRQAPLLTGHGEEGFRAARFPGFEVRPVLGVRGAQRGASAGPASRSITPSAMSSLSISMRAP